MDLKVKAKNIRISAKKTRLVVDLIRGLDVNSAMAQLQVVNKKAALPVSKLLQSGIANAMNTYNINKDNLFIKSAFVDEGITFKRWMPRAHGRATPLRKRSCHISLIFDTIDGKEYKKVGQKDAKPKNQDDKDKGLDEKKIDKANLKKSKSDKVQAADKDHKPEPIDRTMLAGNRHAQHADKKSMKGPGGMKKKTFSKQKEG